MESVSLSSSFIMNSDSTLNIFSILRLLLIGLYRRSIEIVPHIFRYQIRKRTISQVLPNFSALYNIFNLSSVIPDKVSYRTSSVYGYEAIRPIGLKGLTISYSYNHIFTFLVSKRTLRATLLSLASFR